MRDSQQQHHNDDDTSMMVRCWPPSWKPQEEGMMSTTASFPQYKTKVYQTSRRKKTNFRRLMLTGLATAQDNLYMAPYLGRSFALAAMWNLHTTKPKYFAPTNSEVVNLTGLL
jgi:hypothetical protein